MTIWFATGNVHKKNELSAILAGANVLSDGREFLIPADAGLDFDPEETETTFNGNALLKARELYSLLNRNGAWHRGDAVIADDSGLCVDGLDGRPGILSARYAGPEGTAGNGKKLESGERNVLLLGELGDNPCRSARFVCSMVLFYSPDRFFLAQETFEGEIVKGPDFAAGTGGFGYDPILFIHERGCTVAQLSEKEKNNISHRGKAGKVIASLLEKTCQN